MEYAPSNRKRLPYGMMNFADIRFDNYYYVDKTAFIPLIEQSDRFFFFIRPRRFGKSLTLSMLQHYYDVRTRVKFDALFGDLYIGKHPTPDRNSYLVLKLNFPVSAGNCTTTVKDWTHTARPCSTISAISMPTISHKVSKRSWMKIRSGRTIGISVYGVQQD